MTYGSAGRLRHAAVTAPAQDGASHSGSPSQMLRHHHPRPTATVSDVELGIAALMLLIGVVLAVAFIPAIA